MANRFRVAPKDQRTLDGITFASKKEMMRYATLKLMERAGFISELQLQPEFKVFIHGKHFTTYTADFSYLEVAQARFVIEDVKSSGTNKDAAYRLRKKAAELHYGITVSEVIK